MEPTVRDITDLAVSVLDGLDGGAFPAVPAIQLLQRALDATAASYSRLHRWRGLVDMAAPGCCRNVASAREWFRATPTDNPWFCVMKGAALTPATGASVTGSSVAWARNPVHDLLTSLGMGEHLAVLPLVAVDSEITGFSFSRSAREFTPAELGFLRAIQPVLQAAQRHADRMARWRVAGAGSTAGDRDAADPGLTARELAVLGLTARGLTATAAARRLGCSPRTVEKHLDHVYRKLGVNDRVSAVLAAEHRGLLRSRQRAAT